MIFHAFHVQSMENICENFTKTIKKSLLKLILLHNCLLVKCLDRKFCYYFFFRFNMNGDQPFLVKMDVSENPWEVSSLYQFQFFICPQCVFQISSKQGFVNHVHDFHIEAEEFLQKIEVRIG